MEPFDQEKAARVWQRVRQDPPPPSQEADLLALITEERTDAATYLQLSRRFQGKESAALRKMFEQEQAHAACLKGIYTLITGSRPPVRAAEPAPEPLLQRLRRCYGREMHSLARYEARSADPEYGQVFARLAGQERDHCHMLLEVIGKTQK